MTFVFRDPDGEVVSTFSYVYMWANFAPDVAAGGAGGRPIATIRASSVGRDGARLPGAEAGVYSIEAVFHEHTAFDWLGLAEGMLARSERLPVRVFEGKSSD